MAGELPPQPPWPRPCAPAGKAPGLSPQEEGGGREPQPARVWGAQVPGTVPTRSPALSGVPGDELGVNGCFNSGASPFGKGHLHPLKSQLARKSQINLRVDI